MAMYTYLYVMNVDSFSEIIKSQEHGSKSRSEFDLVIVAALKKSIHNVLFGYILLNPVLFLTRTKFALMFKLLLIVFFFNH